MLWWWRWWTGESSDSERKVAEARVLIESQQTEIDELTATLRERDAELGTAHEQAAEAAQAQAGREQTAAQLTADLERARSDAGELETLLRAERDRAEARLSELRRSEADNEQLKARTATLEAELEAERTRSAELEAQLDAQQATADVEQTDAGDDAANNETTVTGDGADDPGGADADGADDPGGADADGADVPGGADADHHAEDSGDSAADVADADQTAAVPDDAPPDTDGAREVLGRRVRADDLTVVEGIGPKIAVLLADEGIDTWRALASTDVERLSEILASAGSRYRMHDPSSWPQQAQMLAEGRWQDFKGFARS